jgi:dihydrofolate synthase/folylpolyglutamate synthase
MSLSRQAVEEGVASVYWPGRFEVRRAGRTWLFDVAHNEAGVHALVNTFREFAWPGPIVLLVGILGDKDWSHMLPPLFQLAERVILTVPPTAPPNRAWDPAAVAATVPARESIVEHDLTQALERALHLSAPGGTVVVTGSFHTVGDVQALLGWSEVEPDFPLQRNVFGG